MKTALFALIILSIFLVSGCVKEVTCSKPYIQVGTDCCLDSNDNSMCDKDEVQNISNNEQTPVVEESKYKIKCITNCNRGITILSQKTENNNFVVTLKNDNTRGCNMTCASTYSGALQIKVPVGESVESTFSFDNAVKNRLMCSDDWVKDKPECDLAISQYFEAE